MRIEYDEDERQKAIDYWHNWHRWFAWRPIRIGHAGVWVWLEWVEARISPFSPFGLSREYRLIRREQR